MSHVVIGLRTVKGAKQLKLDPSIYETLQKEKVEIGDVIYIEANSGAVKVCQMNLVIFYIFFDVFSSGKVDVILMQRNMI